MNMKDDDTELKDRLRELVMTPMIPLLMNQSYLKVQVRNFMLNAV